MPKSLHKITVTLSGTVRDAVYYPDVVVTDAILDDFRLVPMTLWGETRTRTIPARGSLHPGAPVVANGAPGVVVRKLEEQALVEMEDGTWSTVPITEVHFRMCGPAHTVDDLVHLVQVHGHAIHERDGERYLVPAPPEPRAQESEPAREADDAKEAAHPSGDHGPVSDVYGEEAALPVDYGSDESEAEETDSSDESEHSDDSVILVEGDSVSEDASDSDSRIEDDSVSEDASDSDSEDCAPAPERGARPPPTHITSGMRSVAKTLTGDDAEDLRRMQTFNMSGYRYVICNRGKYYPHVDIRRAMSGAPLHPRTSAAEAALDVVRLLRTCIQSTRDDSACAAAVISGITSSSAKTSDSENTSGSEVAGNSAVSSDAAVARTSGGASGSVVERNSAGAAGGTKRAFPHPDEYVEELD